MFSRNIIRSASRITANLLLESVEWPEYEVNLHTTHQYNFQQERNTVRRELADYFIRFEPVTSLQPHDYKKRENTGKTIMRHYIDLFTVQARFDMDYATQLYAEEKQAMSDAFYELHEQFKKGRYKGTTP